MDVIAPQPKVGVGVMILKDGKVLLAKRKNAHGAGAYAFPGGHLEYMESFEDCAVRETAEECGIQIKNIRFLLLANVTAYRPKHYVHITVLAEWASGEPAILEPEKSESWGWYDVNTVPHPLFKFCEISLKAYNTGQQYFGLIDSLT